MLPGFTALPVICTIVFLTTGVTAQSVGFRVGAILANQEISGSGVTFEPDMRIGLDVALVAEVPLSKNIGLQPELHFIQKGTKIAFFDETKVRINYIELPVLIRLLFLGATDDMHIGILAGPSLGYATHGQVEDSTGTMDIEFDGDYVRFEFGGHLGAGAVIPVGDLELLADIRYLLGISDITDDPEGSIKNKGIALGVGIIF